MQQFLGAMIDCSRDAVMNTETVKRYAALLQKMGYHALMLYTEDTFEVDHQPYFGMMRGRFSKAELKELDAYCNGIGVELIPCIQTLAHLENMFRWRGEYGDINDCDNILLADEEKTYRLIGDLFATVSECFTTKKVHIGMDEAYRVGTGKYQQKHGIRDHFDVVYEHLHKVCKIAETYGLEPMIWNDMVMSLACGVQKHHEVPETLTFRTDMSVPQNLSIVYWDYIGTESEKYKQLIDINKKFDRPLYFACGLWTWKSFAYQCNYAMDTVKAGLEACRDRGVDGVFVTWWGDDGSECSRYAALPLMMYAAEVSRGNEDMDSIKTKFREIVGCEYDDFALIGKFNNPDSFPHGKTGEELTRFTPCKALLYNDLFLGLFDYQCKDGDTAYYQALAAELSAVTERGEYEEMFRFYETLARVLALKCNLGRQIRKAYLACDRETMGQYVTACRELEEGLRALHRAFRDSWFVENKPFGFEVHEQRMGGAILRTQSCRERLERWIGGDISSIPELEEPQNSISAGESWRELVTAGRI